MVGESESREFIAIYNSQTRAIDKLNMLNLPAGVKVSCAKYGPYDNGFIVLGLSNGEALGLNYASLSTIGPSIL